MMASLVATGGMIVLAAGAIAALAMVVQCSDPADRRSAALGAGHGRGVRRRT